MLRESGGVPELNAAPLTLRAPGEFAANGAFLVLAGTVHRQPPQGEERSATGLANMSQLRVAHLNNLGHLRRCCVSGSKRGWRCPVGTLCLEVPLAELARPVGTAGQQCKQLSKRRWV